MNSCLRTAICTLGTNETFTDAVSDVFINVFKQTPDFFNPETSTREMVNISNFDVFIRLELNKMENCFKQLNVPIVTPDLIDRVVITSMKKVPSDWIPN